MDNLQEFQFPTTTIVRPATIAIYNTIIVHTLTAVMPITFQVSSKRTIPSIF